jgi:hypothetical protein
MADEHVQFEHKIISLSNPSGTEAKNLRSVYAMRDEHAATLDQWSAEGWQVAMVVTADNWRWEVLLRRPK